MKRFIVILTSIATLAAAAVVRAAGVTAKVDTQTAATASQIKPIPKYAAGHPRASQRAKRHFAKRLGLTEAQRDQIRSVMAAERPAMEPLVEQLAAGRKELRKATANGTFDEAQVRALAEKQAQTLSELIVARARVRSRVFAVLTPEQRAKALELRERRAERLRDRFGA